MAAEHIKHDQYIVELEGTYSLYPQIYAPSHTAPGQRGSNNAGFHSGFFSPYQTRPLPAVSKECLYRP